MAEKKRPVTPDVGKKVRKKSGKIILELINEGPRNEKTGYKVFETDETPDIYTKLKGGGMSQRGLGRAFKKGGKV